MNILDSVLEEAKSRNISLHKLCKMAKVNYQAVWRCVKSGNSPTASTLGKLVLALDMEILLVESGIADKVFKKVEL
jgi:DNA-binding phage protein